MNGILFQLSVQHLNSVGESPPVFTWCNLKGFDFLRTICQPAHFTVLWILLST